MLLYKNSQKQGKSWGDWGDGLRLLDSGVRDVPRKDHPHRGRHPWDCQAQGLLGQIMIVRCLWIIYNYHRGEWRLLVLEWYPPTFPAQQYLIGLQTSPTQHCPRIIKAAGAPCQYLQPCHLSVLALRGSCRKFFQDFSFYSEFCFTAARTEITGIKS